MNPEDMAGIREQLRTPQGVKKLRKALKNRATRWWLKRQGALATVEEELSKAEKQLNSSNHKK